MFGCYWHGCKACYPKTKKKNNEKIIIEHFKKYGFECLVIWEHELKDIKAVSLRLEGF
jgi:G:T-mismatch repair DNA endonuclease (very short patch repair protein)